MRKYNSSIKTAFISEAGSKLENNDYFGFVDDSDVESYTYEGAWADDRPNGEGHIVWNRYPEKIQVEPNHTTSVKTEVTGAFTNGLYHGTIYETWNMNDGSILVWSPIIAVNGWGYFEAFPRYRRAIAESVSPRFTT